MVRWMASKGAKHLIILSRSGCTSQSAHDLVDELTKNNVEVVTPKCDVSSAKALSRVLEQYDRTMPPIRGCINAAMVLNVSDHPPYRGGRFHSRNSLALGFIEGISNPS